MNKYLLYFLFISFFAVIHKTIEAQPCNPAFSHTTSLNTANFTATFNTPGQQHIWQFGDGASGYGAMVSHNYNQQGQFTVKHIVIDSLTSCIDSAVQMISMSFTPFCSSYFYFFDGFPVLNKINFVASPLVTGTTIKKYSWKINGTEVDTTDYFLYTFSTAGTYTVCLKIETYSGCISEYCEQVPVYGYCNRNISFTTSEDPQQPRTITFIPNPNNSQYNYWWHPGNGLGYNEKTPTITFTPGSYDIRLTIIDTTNQCYDTVRQIVNIQGSSADSCTASFTYTLNAQGQTAFTAVSNQTITSQTWTIFNPTDSTQAVILNTFNPVYTFIDTGYYGVCVSLTTNTGCIRSYCETIQVSSVSGRISGRILSYPNPATTEVRLRLAMENAGSMMITVYNISGNIVYRSQQQGVAGNNQLTIPVQRLERGQYFVDIRYGSRKKQSVFQKL